MRWVVARENGRDAEVSVKFSSSSASLQCANGIVVFEERRFAHDVKAKS